MRADRVWIALAAVLLLGAAGGTLWLLNRPAGGTVANVYQNGVCVYSVDLSQVTEGYTVTIEGADGAENLLAVEPGRIRVERATCPDQVCVRQGWLANSAQPIVCLPNGLVIRLEGAAAETGPDAVVR